MEEYYFSIRAERVSAKRSWQGSLCSKRLTFELVEAEIVTEIPSIGSTCEAASVPGNWEGKLEAETEVKCEKENVPVQLAVAAFLTGYYTKAIRKNVISGRLRMLGARNPK